MRQVLTDKDITHEFPLIKERVKPGTVDYVSRELTIPKPHASAQLPDWPERELPKLGSLKAELTKNGAGAIGFG